jgi:hypothetical protein
MDRFVTRSRQDTYDGGLSFYVFDTKLEMAVGLLQDSRDLIQTECDRLNAIKETSCVFCGCTEPLVTDYPGEWPHCPRCGGV